MKIICNWLADWYRYSNYSIMYIEYVLKFTINGMH